MNMWDKIARRYQYKDTDKQRGYIDKYDERYVDFHGYSAYVIGGGIELEKPCVLL